MALTLRQQKFYTDTVDVWHGPGAAGVPLPTDDNDVVTNIVYNPVASPDLTAVKCMLQTQAEGNLYERPLGRTAFDNIFTLDRCFFEAGTAIKDQDVVRIKTAGHPLLNEYFIVQGEGRERESRGARRGNYKVIQLKRSDAPTVAPGTGYSSGFSSGYR